MNNMVKTMSVIGICMASAGATTIIFNGCSNTPNDYFEFTSSGHEYCIGKCAPKLNPASTTTITIKIPGSVNGNQVSLDEEAFDWSAYWFNFDNLRVNLIFEKVGNTYVLAPSGCSYMFSNCHGLTALDMSSFDTSNVTDMSCMFDYCRSLNQLDLRGLDTSNVTDMNAMFNWCSNLTLLNLSNLNTENVTNMSWMFSGCSGLTTLKVSPAFVVSSNTGTGGMFNECNKNLTVIAPSGSDKNGFIEADEEAKSQINKNASKVYVLESSPEISEGLATVLTNNGIKTGTESLDEVDPSALFNATANDAIYIGKSTSDQTMVIDGADKAILAALINKAIDGIGYYPASLQLTGSITLSGDNSGFTQKTLIVGDAVKDTVITFTDPKALPETDIVVESKGKLVFTGPSKYSITHKITFKSADLLFSVNRIICLNGATIEFAS